MPTIFITRQIPDIAMTMLQKQGHDVMMGAAKLLTRSELLVRVKGVHALIPVLNERIDAELLDAAGPQLKIVANYAVGFDNVDLAAAKARGVIITNTPVPEVTTAVAEHTLALMLGLSRRIAEADVYAKGEHYTGWDPLLLLGTQLAGKTLGIVGLGRIGKEVARRGADGLGMNVISTSDHTLEQVLQQSDVMSLHVPLSPQTRHMISTEQFAMMKKTTYLINTARGPVVDEKALLRALKTNRIAGAALDVYECEPHVDCDLTDHLELKAFSNVILTPHIASATVEARVAMARCAAENIIAVLSGAPPLNPAK